MRETFNWLHLSDFHVGMDDYGQRKLFKEIVGYVADAVTNGQRYDCVFITGDIADKGLAEQYDIFLEELLIPLTEAMGENWQGSIFSVPGNHDVDRLKAAYFNPADILKTDTHFFDPTISGKEKRAQFFPRFDAYTRGVTSFTPAPANWLESEQATFSSVIKIALGDVVVIGCNTAWLSKDEQDRHRLSPGVNAIGDALERAHLAALKIVWGTILRTGWMMMTHSAFKAFWGSITHCTCVATCIRLMLVMKTVQQEIS
jgi:hypothetical protein